MGKKNDHEIRKSRKATVLGTLAGHVMRLWSWTVRYEVNDLSGSDGSEGPRILVMWHNRIFAVPPIWEKTLGRQRKCVVLTSASHDGAMLAHAMAAFGLGAVRGSSSRRGVAALIGLKRALEAGNDICITPDGPRGPRYEVQGGAVKVAEFSGVKLLPMHAKFSSAWRLKTWDRLVIPKPFSKVSITYGETLAVERGLDETAFETFRARLEQILRDGTDDA